MSDHISPTSATEKILGDHFQRFKQGDDNALSYIYESLHKSVFKLARSMMKNEFEIKTIVQEAFTLIWIRRKSIKNINHLKWYVRKRVRWDCLTYLRNGTSRTDSLDLYDDKGITLAVYNPQEEKELMEAERRQEEDRQLIEQAISYLPPGKRIVIELRKRGISHKTIAKKAGKTYQKIMQEEKAILRELKSNTKRLKIIIAAARQRRTISITDYEIYLSPRQIQIFKLHYEEKQSMFQIAEKLGLSQWLILAQHFKAVQKLRKINRPDWNGFPAN